MPSDEVAFLRVKVETADVTSQVWHVDVEDVDRGSDKVTLIMDNPGSTNTDPVREGQVVRVELGWETENALAFEGRVVGTRTIAHQGAQRLQVTAFDFSNRLAAAPTPEDPPQFVGTLEEIVRQIAERHTIEFGAVSVDPMPSYTEEEPLVRRGRNDWQLLQDEAERLRARVFVEVNAAEGDSEEARSRGGTSRLYFATEESLLAQDPMGTLHYCPGFGSLLEFDYQRVASGAAPSATATVTDPATGSAATAEGTPPAEEPPATADTERSATVETMYGEGRARSYEGGLQVAEDAEVQPADLRARRTLNGLPSSPPFAETLVRQDRTRILGFHGRGLATGTVFLRAKGSVEIEGMIASWAKGRWYVWRVNHLVQRAVVRERERQRESITYRTSFGATR